jgi:hypothetical protein
MYQTGEKGDKDNYAAKAHRWSYGLLRCHEDADCRVAVGERGGVKRLSPACGLQAPA